MPSRSFRQHRSCGGETAAVVTTFRADDGLRWLLVGTSSARGRVRLDHFGSHEGSHEGVRNQNGGRGRVHRETFGSEATILNYRTGRPARGGQSSELTVVVSHRRWCNLLHPRVAANCTGNVLRDEKWGPLNASLPRTCHVGDVQKNGAQRLERLVDQGCTCPALGPTVVGFNTRVRCNEIPASLQGGLFTLSR